MTGELAWDDAAVLEGGVILGTSVEADGLGIPVGEIEGGAVGVEAEGITLGVETEGSDVGVEAEGTRFGIEVGVVEDGVVGGSTGFDVLDVEDIAAGGVLDIT